MPDTTDITEEETPTVLLNSDTDTPGEDYASLIYQYLIERDESDPTVKIVDNNNLKMAVRHEITTGDMLVTLALLVVAVLQVLRMVYKSGQFVSSRHWRANHRLLFSYIVSQYVTSLEVMTVMISDMIYMAAKSFFAADVVLYTLTSVSVVVTILVIISRLRGEV